MDTEKNDDKFTQSVGFDEALDKTGEKIYDSIFRHRRARISS